MSSQKNISLGCVIHVKPKKLIVFILTWIKSCHGKILAGLPLNMDGTSSSTTEFVLKFVEMLRAQSPVPVITWDERLSSAAVERVLIDGDMSRSRRKEVIDKMAAAYILQGYLDSRERASG